jgi:hypothetical protein
VVVGVELASWIEGAAVEMARPAQVLLLVVAAVRA